MGQGNCFKGRQFTEEVILWAVRWYLMFPISYRDLELMLGDRGVEVDHTTIFRWIQAYAADLEKRLRPHLRRCTGSWHCVAVRQIDPRDPAFNPSATKPEFVGNLPDGTAPFKKRPDLVE